MLDWAKERRASQKAATMPVNNGTCEWLISDGCMDWSTMLKHACDIDSGKRIQFAAYIAYALPVTPSRHWPPLTLASLSVCANCAVLQIEASVKAYIIRAVAATGLGLEAVLRLETSSSNYEVSMRLPASCLQSPNAIESTSKSDSEELFRSRLRGCEACQPASRFQPPWTD